MNFNEMIFSAEEDPAKKDDKGKKPWKEGGGDKWSHDKFNESDQAPKSRDELVTSYGYDIRSEEGPPRARRRRRYGWVHLKIFGVKGIF